MVKKVLLCCLLNFKDPRTNSRENNVFTDKYVPLPYVV